jgi:hypothetical protein
MAGRAAINQDFLYAALGTPAYAAFFTESRMRRIDSNKLNRKSRSSKSQGKEEAREEGQATTPPPLYWVPAGESLLKSTATIRHPILDDFSARVGDHKPTRTSSIPS